MKRKIVTEKLEAFATSLVLELESALGAHVEQMLARAHDAAVATIKAGVAGGQSAFDTARKPVATPARKPVAQRAKPAATLAGRRQANGKAMPRCSKCGFVGGNARGCGTAHEPRTPAAKTKPAAGGDEDEGAVQATRVEDPEDAYPSLVGKARMKDEDVRRLVAVAQTSTGRRRERALDFLVRKNMGLVFMLARKYQHFGVELEELVQEGSAGLVKGILRFDLARGTKLSTYVLWWIRHAVSRAVENLGSTIRVPVHAYEKLLRVKRRTKHLDDRATLDEMAEASGVPAKEIEKLLTHGRVTSYLDALVGEDGATMHDLVASDVIVHDDEAEETAERRAALDAAIAALPPQQADVIRRRFLSGEGVVPTLEEVGHHIASRHGVGVSRERVRQLERDAFANLRAALRKTVIAHVVRRRREAN